MWMQVAFEITTPLLHTLGCMKVAGRHRTKPYIVLSGSFMHLEPLPACLSPLHISDYGLSHMLGRP